MSSQNRNKQVQCSVCLQIMRSDVLNRHIDNIHADAENPGVREQLLLDNELYFKNVALGKQVFDVVSSGEIEQESLSPLHAYAFGLYNKMRPILKVESVELRAWQNQALQLLDEPTSRQVIWIKGRQGNEGKSWLQSYVQSLYGFSRTVRLNFKSKANDIYCALSKRPLATTDIFIFNDTRTTSDDIGSCYSVLEAIKDGTAISGKYQSEVIRFKTPNIVLVFSNTDPDIIQLSRDRWQTFQITKDGLERSDGKLCEQKAIVKRKWNMK